MSDQVELPRNLRLYDQECVDLLRQALAKAKSDLEPTLSYYDTRTKDNESSSDEEEDDDPSDSESSSSASEGDSDSEKGSAVVQSGDANDQGDVHVDVSKQPPPAENKMPPKKQPKKTQKERKQEALLQQLGTPPMLALSLGNDTCLNVPSALLVKQERHYSFDSCKNLLELSESTSSSQPVIVLLLRSGRFAGGVFCKNNCLVHRTCQRYTVRKGQGKAQSTQDKSRAPKSVGAQLRRQGEVKLWQDIKETMQQWKHHLQETPLILVSCPKTLQKGLYEAAGDLLNRDLIRKIPLDVGPTFEGVVAVHEKMMESVVSVMPAEESVEACPDESAEKKVNIEKLHIKGESDDQDKAKEIIKEFPHVTPLHTFAAEGRQIELEELLESDSDACAELMNHGAGQDFMTPLHYAAESASNGVDPATAAALVSLLLVKGGADPCTVDGRNRIPYFLASHDKVREAFRRSRAELGEDCWPWDTAKVGPALTEDDVAAKKEKAAEKKRRQRARQKEKKARERAEAQAMEQRRREEEQNRKQEEDAKRIRDGLAPKKSNATNVCDYCQTVCKGKRRNQMFQRLDYVYCSSECVQKHKRELMAQAALSRLS